MTISLAADPNQQRFTIPAALFLKKKLGVNEEKMDEELAFLDRGVLSQKLTELGIPPPSAIA